MSKTINSSWIAMSDFFCTMMMIFMLLTVTMIQKTYILDKSSQTKINNLTNKLENEKSKMNCLISESNISISRLNSLVIALRSEFNNDLPKWHAEILDDTTLRFENPDILFRTGMSELNERFKSILDLFIPRYMAILNQPQYKPYIREIRIEGHTSSIWNNHTGVKQAYILNMQLSQARTVNTLTYIINLASTEKYYDWMHDKVTANGFSSSHPLVADITSTKNQRVEFKVILDNEHIKRRISNEINN